jgi:SAM-dependent methyltransferase
MAVQAPRGTDGTIGRVEQLLRATARAEARHFWFRGFRAFVTPPVRRALRGRTAPRILDCGCGTGANLDLLSRFGRAYGFDLSETGLRIARHEGRTSTARATVTAAPFPDAAFDLVTSFDVLYALEAADERAAARELFRVLKPGGFALVNVAAMPMLTGDHSILSRERRRYTRASLRRLVEDAGFRVVRLTYTNASLFVPLAIVRAYHRWRGLSAESDAQQEISVPAAPINAALSALLRIESLWLRAIDNPFGSSLLCLAMKPDGDGAPR